MLRVSLILMALCLSLATFGAEDSDPTVPVGASAPPITGKVWVTENDKAPDFQGKVYLVDFWFANCVSCIEAMPLLNKISKKYEGKGLLVLGLSLDSLTMVKQTKEKMKLTYPLLTDAKLSEKAWSVEFYPSLFLVGKDGKIVWKGDVSDKKLLEVIEAALAK